MLLNWYKLMLPLLIDELRWSWCWVHDYFNKSIGSRLGAESKLIQSKLQYVFQQIWTEAFVLANTSGAKIFRFISEEWWRSSKLIMRWTCEKWRSPISRYRRLAAVSGAAQLPSDHSQQLSGLNAQPSIHKARSKWFNIPLSWLRQ